MWLHFIGANEEFIKLSKLHAPQGLDIMCPQTIIWKQVDIFDRIIFRRDRHRHFHLFALQILCATLSLYQKKKLSGLYIIDLVLINPCAYVSIHLIVELWIDYKNISRVNDLKNCHQLKYKHLFQLKNVTIFSLHLKATTVNLINRIIYTEEWFE